jgi:hypothetical protein
MAATASLEELATKICVPSGLTVIPSGFSTLASVDAFRVAGSMTETVLFKKLVT